MKSRKVLFTVFLLAVILCTLVAACSAGRVKAVSNSSAGFTMWQLPSQIGSIGMSYVIRTQNGKIIVIDGGMKEDAAYLRGFLAALGNNVDAWYISHPHDDHAGALNDLLKSLKDLKIGTIYTSLCDRDWYTKVELDCLPFTEEFYGNLRTSGIRVVDVPLGMTQNIDGVNFKVLGIKNPEFTNNAYNESSMVLRVWDARKSILFLGDLGVEGGKKLVAGRYAKELPCDYVQMAHHGQNGVDENCYKAIRPKYCLWPTPLWLWNNDSGKGIGTGPWSTLDVRKWMDNLGVRKNYPSHLGLVEIR